MKVGIVGASGYVGGEVVRLLLSHPEAEVSMVTSTKHVGEYLHRIHPSLKGFTELTFSELDYDKMSDKCDLVFTAVPHGTATEIVKTFYDRGMKIIDLSQIIDYTMLMTIQNGMVGNIHILITCQNQYLVFRNFIGIKLKMHS